MSMLTCGGSLQEITIMTGLTVISWHLRGPIMDRQSMLNGPWVSILPAITYYNVLIMR
jgi:hypothetical protein